MGGVWRYRVTYTRECEKCHTEFSTHRRKVLKCKTCMVCGYCGNVVAHSWVKFCSRQCRSLYIDANRPIRLCVVCGTGFSLNDFPELKNRYSCRDTCSKQCQWAKFSASTDRKALGERIKALRAKGAFRIKQCTFCGASYKPTSSTQRWCGTCTDCSCCGLTFHKTYRAVNHWYPLCSLGCFIEFKKLTKSEWVRMNAVNARIRPPYHASKRSGSPAWVKSVIAASNGICAHCHLPKSRLEAHHIKPWKEHPELRLDVSNGEAVCYSCHRHHHFPNTRNREFE